MRAVVHPYITYLHALIVYTMAKTLSTNIYWKKTNNTINKTYSKTLNN